MAEELDEFGIPVRNSKPTVDEFGIPLKKKVASATGGYGSQLGSQTFQPTKAYVPAPFIGEAPKAYKAPSQPKAAKKPEVSYGQNLEAMFASGVDQLGRMVSSIPSGLLDLSIQAFGTPALKASMDAEALGKLAEKQLGVKEKYNPFSPNNYLANLYKERGKTAQAATNLKYGGSVSDAVSNGDYAEAGKLLSLNVAQALPVMVGLVASRGAGASEAASLIGLGVGTQAQTYQDLKQQYPDIDKNTLLTNSILTGLGEAGSELVGTSLLYNQGRKLLAKGATKEAEDLVKGGVKSYLDNAFKKAFVGSAVISDASGEMANQVWKNFVDKETVDPNKQLLDGVLDAGIVSLGMTGPVAGGIKVADRVINPVAKQTITDNSNKIQEINKELDNPDVNTTTKALLLNQVSDLTEKVNDAIDEDNNIYKSLDEGQKEEVNRIADEIDGLTESLQSSNISEPTKELLKGQIETLNTQLQDAIQKPSTTSQVPPVIEGEQNIQEGGEGVGQSIQGTQAPQEVIAKEEVVIPDFKTESNERKSEAIKKYKSISDIDLESRFNNLESKDVLTDSDKNELRDIEYVQENREWNSILNVSPEEALNNLNKLKSSETSFIEKRDIRESADIINKYKNASELTDNDIKKDFKESLFGNPTTWYADALKLKQSVQESINRGISPSDLTDYAEAEFIKDGYDEATAKSTVSNMLRPIFERNNLLNQEKPKELVSKKELVQPKKQFTEEEVNSNGYDLVEKLPSLGKTKGMPTLKQQQELEAKGIDMNNVVFFSMKDGSVGVGLSRELTTKAPQEEVVTPVEPNIIKFTQKDGTKIDVDLNGLELVGPENVDFESGNLYQFAIKSGDNKLGAIEVGKKGDDVQIAVSAIFKNINSEYQKPFMDRVLDLLKNVFVKPFKNVVITDSPNRGKGIGKVAYGILAKTLKDNYGKKLISDTNRSDAAEGLWRSLERQGLAKVIGDKNGPREGYYYEYVVPEVKETIIETPEFTAVKDEVFSARGKENKTDALVRLKDVATEEEFQNFLDENPRFNKYVEGGPEQKKLGASRIVGEAIQPEEFTEFEEVTNEDAEAMLRDSIETPFRNKEKLDKTSKSLVSRIIKAAFDSQYEVIQKLLKQGGDIGKVAVATLKNRKGYNGKASIINRLFNKEIFDDLSSAPNLEVSGRKISEKELFDVFLNLNRIINIDARISDKFAQLVQVDRKIKEGIKNKSLDKEQLAELENQKSILYEYLKDRKAVNVVNGEYVPVQYLHPKNRTAATARAELAVLKSALPDVYKKLSKSYDAYTDAFRFLLDEQYKNGMISKSVYDELFSYNYIPTKYIQYFIENELSQDNPVLASKLSSSIKNLTGGSDSDVITNFQAILELYTNSVYKRIYENRAAKSLAKSVRDTGEQSKSLMRTNQLVKDADAKLSKQPMYNINLDMYIQEPTGEDKFGNPTYGDVPTGYDVIYFYDADGKRERVVASKDFVDTWYDRGGLLSPKGEEYLAGISKWSGVNLFKSLITKNNPAFGIYQILQDAPQALIATKAYPDLILGSAQLASDYATVSKDIVKFIKNDEITPLFKEAIDAGIFSDFLSTESDILRSQTLVNADGSTNYKTTAKALKSRLGKAVGDTLNSIAQTNEAIEYLTRLAVYKRMKQNLVSKYTKENGGVEPTENQMFDIQQLAAQEARNVVDFSRSGTIIKPLNKVFAYLNAGMQAFYSSARSLKNNPTKAAVMLTEIGLGGVAVMAMSLGAYGDDKEKKKRLAKYMMLSKYQKANYFNIYNPYTDDPEMEWIRIPKPQPFRGFINLLEQGYLHNVMGVDIDMKQAKEAFSNDIPVSPEWFGVTDLITRNPFVNGVIKYSFNYDAFRNQDVVKNAEKIEDWAEGIDDENVSKLYKQLGKSTKDLLGGEGISPKRAQAFSQSLIGDPSRNTTTAVLDKFGKSLFYIINGDEKGLDEEFGDRTVADNIFKLTGLKGRLFSKTPKMDASFMEGLDEQRRELFTKRLLIRSEIEDIYNTADSKQEANKLVNERLNELVKNKDITPQYKKKIIASETKKDILKDKPSWYKSLLYSESNDEKVQILKHYTKDMSNDEYKKAAMFLLQNKIISPEVTKEFAIVRNKK
jgi:hypothetical protein